MLPEGVRRIPPPTFLLLAGLKYVRLHLAFPIEALRRKLLIQVQPEQVAAMREGKLLSFERALGTALVYAYLDVKSIVSHAEMASRIYEAGKLPLVLPDGITFRLLVTEFKTMLGGNLTFSEKS